MAVAADMTTREWYRPLPPYEEVDWSARNNTNYEETGVLTALQLTSAFPEIILENFYKKSRNSIESGKKDAPYGYVFPASQPDMTRVAFIVNILRTAGHRGRARQRRSETRRKELSRPDRWCQAQSAVRPPGENSARKAKFPRSRA